VQRDFISRLSNDCINDATLKQYEDHIIRHDHATIVCALAATKNLKIYFFILLDFRKKEKLINFRIIS